MQIVLNVSDELAEYFAHHNSMSDDGWFSHSSQLLNAFRNGTPLEPCEKAISARAVIAVASKEKGADLRTLLPSRSCSSCTHSGETGGEHCYECVKGICDNYEEDGEQE